MQQAASLLRPNPTRALCTTQPLAFSSVHCAPTTKRTSHRRTATTMALTVTRLKSLGFKGTIYKFQPGTNFPWHTHAYDKMDTILTGKFRIMDRQQEVILEPGDMLELPAGLEHYAETVGDDVVTFVDATRC